MAGGIDEREEGRKDCRIDELLNECIYTYRYIQWSYDAVFVNKYM